jgi:hypothetical protein
MRLLEVSILIILGLIEMVPSGNIGTASVTFPLTYQSNSNLVILGNYFFYLGANSFGISNADTDF